jgi:hypothetical protein
MNNRIVLIYFRCAKCGGWCRTAQHQTKYQGGYGKRVALTKCCLAPIGPCCYNPPEGSKPKGETCLFCPMDECTSFYWILKRRINETYCGYNGHVTFENWDYYLRSMYVFDDYSSPMPRLREFLIWVARNHPDVTIRWYNLHLKSVRDLYVVFNASQPSAQ